MSLCILGDHCINPRKYNLLHLLNKSPEFAVLTPVLWAQAHPPPPLITLRGCISAAAAAHLISSPFLFGLIQFDCCVHPFGAPTQPTVASCSMIAATAAAAAKLAAYAACAFLFCALGSFSHIRDSLGCRALKSLSCALAPTQPPLTSFMDRQGASL